MPSSVNFWWIQMRQAWVGQILIDYDDNADADYDMIWMATTMMTRTMTMMTVTMTTMAMTTAMTITLLIGTRLWWQKRLRWWWQLHDQNMIMMTETWVGRTHTSKGSLYSSSFWYGVNQFFTTSKSGLNNALLSEFLHFCAQSKCIILPHMEFSADGLPVALAYLLLDCEDCMYIMCIGYVPMFLNVLKCVVKRKRALPHHLVDLLLPLLLGHQVLGVHSPAHPQFTLVAFVPLFCAVSPQRCKITLVAFVSLFFCYFLKMCSIWNWSR